MAETQEAPAQTQGQATQQPAAAAPEPQSAQATPAPKADFSALSILKGFTSAVTQAEIENFAKNGVTEKKDEPATRKEEKPENKTVAVAAQAENKEAVDNKNEGATKPEIKPEAKPEEDESTKEPEGKKSVLGLSKKDKKNEIVIESPEHILSVVKSKFGQDIKDIKGLPKFFESAEKWRADSQKAEALESENKQLKKLWEEDLPQEFLDAAQMYLKGEEYMKAFSARAPFDFNKKAEKQDKEALVNHYFPNKFTPEDFKEKDPSELLQMATETAIEKFNAEKQVRENQRAAQAEQSKKLFEAQKAAVNSSVGVLKQRFPDMDKENFNEVKSVLDGGVNKVLSYFFNNDGTVKPEAAVRLTMAMHGEDEIQMALQKEATKIETKINEEILSRGADTPKPVQRAGKPEEIDPEVKKQIETLKGATKKNTF